MMHLILLLGLHHVGDTIQPPWLIENKKSRLFAHWEHAFAWATIVSLGLLFCGELTISKFAFLLLGHFAIDVTKYIIVPAKWGHRYWYIYPDQALHYLQVIAVWAL